MTDEIEREDEQVLTAEYILGLLTPAESDAYEEVLAVDPALRDEYAFWADRIVALTDDIAPVTPPARLLSQIKATIFHEPVPSRAAAGRSWLARLGLLPAIAGGLAAAAVVLWLVTTVVPPGDVAPGAVPTYVAQIAAADESLVVQASYDPAAQALTLDRSVGTARPGRALELWLIAGDNPPVSLGVLPEDQQAVIPVSAAIADSLQGGTLAISDEPPGGSTTGAPTGDVLAVGQVVDA